MKWFALLVASIVGLAGCASHVAGRARALSPAALARLVHARDTYATDAVPPRLRDPMTERARAAFVGAMSAAARASVVHDPALDLVAAAFAETNSEESRGMAGPVLTWLFWRAGSTSMLLAARARWWTGPGAAEHLDDELLQLGRQLGGDEPRSYGVARFAGGRMVWQAVVLARRPLASVSMLRKVYAPGETVRVRVLPRRPYGDLVLYLGREGEPVREHLMVAQPDGSASVALPAPTSAGRYFVEITGTDLRSGRGALRTLLWVPIYVGVPEATVPDEPLLRPEPNPDPPEAWPDRLLATYNAERARLGRGPLRLDERLSAAARVRASALGRFDAPWLAEIAGPHVDQHAQPAARATALHPARRISGWQSSFEFLADVSHMQLLRPTARLALLESESSRLGIGIAPRVNTEGIVEYELVEYLEP